jgi:hypothetical protein
MYLKFLRISQCLNYFELDSNKSIGKREGALFLRATTSRPNQTGPANTGWQPTSRGNRGAREPGAQAAVPTGSGQNPVRAGGEDQRGGGLAYPAAR